MNNLEKPLPRNVVWQFSGSRLHVVMSAVCVCHIPVLASFPTHVYGIIDAANSLLGFIR